MCVDFGRTASDYSRYRLGFPEEFFEHVHALGLIPVGTRLLDVGSGTGTIARGMAGRGCRCYALDISPQLLKRARQLDAAANVDTTYLVASAEKSALAAASFDVVCAGQCWHWFDGIKAAKEIRRILVSRGSIIIAHFDWLPLAGNVVTATEALISRYNPAWKLGGGNGVYPLWLEHLSAAGFVQLETFTFDLDVSYGHEAWRGRIRASAGVGASLDAEQIRHFDNDLKDILHRSFPSNPLDVPHRVFVVIGKKPAN